MECGALVCVVNRWWETYQCSDKSIKATGCSLSWKIMVMMIFYILFESLSFWCRKKKILSCRVLLNLKKSQTGKKLLTNKQLFFQVGSLAFLSGCLYYIVDLLLQWQIPKSFKRCSFKMKFYSCSRVTHEEVVTYHREVVVINGPEKDTLKDSALIQHAALNMR